jgi:hypothetical protein
MSEKKYVLVFLVFLCSFAQTTPVQSFDNLIQDLNKLTPLNRIYRTTKHVDTLLANNTPLPIIAQRIDSLIVYYKKVNDLETAEFLRFYDKIKKGLLPLPIKEIEAVFKDAVVFYEKEGNDRYTGVGHFYLAKHYYEQRDYGNAFYHQAKAQKLFNKVGVKNIIDISRYLHVMALNYYHFGYYEEVIRLMRASITMPAFNENIEIQRYNTLGLAYKKRNMMDSSAYFFERTKEMAESMQDRNWIHISAGNIGDIYNSQGRYKEALPILMQDYQFNQNKNHYPMLARNAALSIAKLWQNLEKPDSTLHYLRAGERLNSLHKLKDPMWREQRDEQYYLEYYELFHNYYKEKDNAQLAYLYLDSLTTLRAATDLRYNKMTEQVAKDRLKIEQHMEELADQEKEKQRISTSLLLIIGVIGFIAVLVGLLYYMSLRREAKALQEQVKGQAAQEKAEAQLALAKMELLEYMQNLQEKNMMVETLQNKLDMLANGNDSESTELEDLTSRLAHTKLLTNDDWNDFRLRFNRAFGGELDKLKLKYRDLTSAEERIYALEKMHVGTSQMAWMLGISPESVRKTRYRLRKKISNVESV